MKKQKEKKEDHPILNQVLTPEFLKQFKDSGKLNSFLEELYARAMEQMLEGELDGHLGYEKDSPDGINSGNSRNGRTSKKVKTTLGEVELEIPRDRNSTFEPVLIPKRSRAVEGVEDIIISLYARGMTVYSYFKSSLKVFFFFRMFVNNNCIIIDKTNHTVSMSCKKLPELCCQRRCMRQPELISAGCLP